MGDTTARPRQPPWTASKAVRATPSPSGPKLVPKLSAETMALITEDALLLSKVALIGVAPLKHPSRSELQEWVNINLTDPHLKVVRIRMLPRGYFVLTFE